MASQTYISALPPVEDTLETKIWRKLGMSEDEIREMLERRTAQVADLDQKREGGFWPFELERADQPELTPIEGQEEPGFIERAIGAIDPIAAAVAPFAGVNPLTGKKIEAKKVAPGSRGRGGRDVPVEFHADMMDAIDPVARGVARDGATDSQLRYELHTRGQRDKALRDEMGKPRESMDSIQNQAGKMYVDSQLAKNRLDEAMKRATPDQMAAAVEQAKSIAAARRSAGFPWKQAYDKALLEALTVGAAPVELRSKVEGAGDTARVARDTKPRATQEVTPAKNQAEVDAIHEQMLAEIFASSGPELDMAETVQQQRKPQRMIVEYPEYLEGRGARPVQRDPAMEVGPVGAIDPATGALIGGPSSKLAPRNYKDPLTDVLKRYFAKPEPEPKKSVAKKPLTREEWEAKRRKP